jgi:hypothetical protein
MCCHRAHPSPLLLWGGEGELFCGTSSRRSPIASANTGLISVTPSAYLNSRQFVKFVSKVFADGHHHVAPTELWNFLRCVSTKMPALRALKIESVFIRVHPWLKNFRVVCVFRGSPHPLRRRNLFSFISHGELLILGRDSKLILEAARDAGRPGPCRTPANSFHRFPSASSRVKKSVIHP